VEENTRQKLNRTVDPTTHTYTYTYKHEILLFSVLFFFLETSPAASAQAVRTRCFVNVIYFKGDKERKGLWV
jgi:hypothetical protein